MADLFTGRLSYLELAAFLRYLPQESAYRTQRRNQFSDEELAQMGDETAPHGPWSHSELLLAAIFDALQTLAHIQIAAWAGVKQDPPEPLRRPGVVVKRREVSPQAVAYLDRIRQLHAQQREADNGT